MGMNGRTAILLFGLVAAAITALSAPAIALAHGHAHAELLEHASEPHHSAPGAVPAVDSHGHEHGHAHSEVEPGLCSRCTKLTLRVPGTPEPALTLAVAVAAPAAPEPIPDESPPRLDRDPQNHPRPPPISV